MKFCNELFKKRYVQNPIKTTTSQHPQTKGNQLENQTVTSLEYNIIIIPIIS